MEGAVLGWALLLLAAAALIYGFYFLVKQAVKAALREWEQEKEDKSAFN